MEINVLAMNVGNTRLAMGVFGGGELKTAKRIKHEDKNTWHDAIADAWSQVGTTDAAVVAATVNPALTELLEHTVDQVTGRNIVWVGRELDLPIKVLTDEPAQTGVDRVLNVAAAYELMGKACVVVDAGTAITVDVCNDAGEFLGGAILPGTHLMLSSLHEHTAKLPMVNLALPEGGFGRSTRGAIQQGVYHGIRGAVKELVENYATALGHWPDLIATGGDAELLFDRWELVHAVSPNLTLYGIALAYTEHHINNET